jgi:hypothetical protein
VSRLREQCGPAERAEIERLLDELVEPETRGTARVLLPESGAARLRGMARPCDDGAWEVDFTDVAILVADVIESGGTIVEPESAAQQQRHALAAVVDRHGGTDA